MRFLLLLIFAMLLVGCDTPPEDVGRYHLSERLVANMYLFQSDTVTGDVRICRLTDPNTLTLACGPWHPGRPFVPPEGSLD